MPHSPFRLFERHLSRKAANYFGNIIQGYIVFIWRPLEEDSAELLDGWKEEMLDDDRPDDRKH